MPSKTKKGREVLQHPTTQEAATLFIEQRADYNHLDQEFTTAARRPLFSDEYVAALKSLNARTV